jgi:hypothetical protein
MGARLRSKRNGSRSQERLPEPSEHRQIGVERDALNAANAERGEAVVVLQASELALAGGGPGGRIRFDRLLFLTRRA